MRLLLLFWLLSSAGELNASADAQWEPPMASAHIDEWAPNLVSCAPQTIFMREDGFKFTEGSQEQGCGRVLVPISVHPAATAIIVRFESDRLVQRSFEGPTEFHQTVQLLADGVVHSNELLHPPHETTQPLREHELRFDIPAGELELAWTFLEPPGLQTGVRNEASVRNIRVIEAGIPLATEGSLIHVPELRGAVTLTAEAEGQWSLRQIWGPAGRIPLDGAALRTSGGSTEIAWPASQGSGDYRVMLQPAGSVPPGWAAAGGILFVAAAVSMALLRRGSDRKALLGVTLAAAALYLVALVPLMEATTASLFHAIHFGLLGLVGVPASLASIKGKPSRVEQELAAGLLDANDALRSMCAHDVHQDALEAYVLLFHLRTPVTPVTVGLAQMMDEVLEAATPALVSRGTRVLEPTCPSIPVISDAVYIPSALASLLARCEGDVQLDWRLSRRVMLSFPAPRGTMEEKLLRAALEPIGGSIARSATTIHIVWSTP